MSDPEITYLRASHQRLCDEYNALVGAVIAMLGAIRWPRDAAEREAIEGVRELLGLGRIPEPVDWRRP